MIPVVVIRPQPGCDATVEAAGTMGLNARGFPLFETRPIVWSPPARHSFDALLIGSANALRHTWPALDAYRGKPVYAVGETTADAARAAGLVIAGVGKGGLQRVLDQVRPEHRRLLRLAGRERVELEAPPEVTIEERVVYASEPLPMPGDLAALLAEPALILLHSGEAASHFAQLCDAAGIPRSRLHVAALGPRVAKAAGEGWASLRTSYPPRDAALLAIAREMCEDTPAMTSDQPGDARDEPQIQPQRVGRSGLGLGTVIAATLVAFIIGAAAVGWLVWSGSAESILPQRVEAPSPAVPPSTPQPAAPRTLADISSVEGRLALVEDRLSRVTADAGAASGSAARAEGLLIAAATRRAIERGAPLGPLEDQLKLRFGDAQPNAVSTIIAAARQPVTLAQLGGQLEAAAPLLAGRPAGESSWTRVRREIASLFVIRRSASTDPAPLQRVERAQVLLRSGDVEKAVAEIERLPGAGEAGSWIASARRYDMVQRALDQIETAALLEPRRLRDDRGDAVDQPSPIAAAVATRAT